MIPAYNFHTKCYNKKSAWILFNDSQHARNVRDDEVTLEHKKLNITINYVLNFSRREGKICRNWIFADLQFMEVEMKPKEKFSKMGINRFFF